jgi:hypothetical protein
VQDLLSQRQSNTMGKQTAARDEAMPSMQVGKGSALLRTAYWRFGRAAAEL